MCVVLSFYLFLHRKNHFSYDGTKLLKERAKAIRPGMILYIDDSTTTDAPLTVDGPTIASNPLTPTHTHMYVHTHIHTWPHTHPVCTWTHTCSSIILVFCTCTLITCPTLSSLGGANRISFVGLQTIAYLHNVKYICISGDLHYISCDLNTTDYANCYSCVIMATAFVLFHLQAEEYW